MSRERTHLEQTLAKLESDFARRLAAGEDTKHLIGAMAVCARALDKLDGLRPTDQSVTVDSVVTETTRDGLVRKAPSLREIATALGCTHGFLSQARAGRTRIRRSWARKIAKWRPDLPATAATWPLGWAADPDEK